jgi:regulatory protein
VSGRASTCRRSPLSTSDRRRSGEVEPPPDRDDAGGDPVEVARRIVLTQLSRAPRTRAQLLDACRRRGVPDDAADRVLDRFAELGLVDDVSFAQAWVESRHRGRGLARRALTRELRHRGVDEQTVADAVAALDPQTEREAAESLVRSRLPGLARYDRATTTRRLHGMLVRRGYSGGLALAVVRDVLDESAQQSWGREGHEQDT